MWPPPLVMLAAVGLTSAPSRGSAPRGHAIPVAVAIAARARSAPESPVPGPAGPRGDPYMCAHVRSMDIPESMGVRRAGG